MLMLFICSTCMYVYNSLYTPTYLLLENTYYTASTKMLLDTHLILGSDGFHRLSNITDSNTITTARRRTIKTPMNIPPISPALAEVLCPVLSSLGGGVPSGFLAVGLVSGVPTVVVIRGGDTNWQS